MLYDAREPEGQRAVAGDATAEVTVNDPFMPGPAGTVEFDSGGTHYGALLGFHW